tara:strand:+ start:2083 stop:2247 length:165 start_codon:yes stop_codon:yes gene_type:complete
MLSHISLGAYYKMMFSMVQHHKYSISDLENILPYERDLYAEMLVDFIEEQNNKQ